MVPESSLAKNLCHICHAKLTISSAVIFPMCFMLFCFFMSRGGSLRALMAKAEVEGTTLIRPMLNVKVHYIRPFISLVALVMSPPSFFGDRLRG